MEPWSPEWKQARLDELYALWNVCEDCELSQTRKKVVFGEGNPDADILFICEKPGEEEDKSGRPFQGRAGAMFDIVLDAVELDRDDIYITNVVACRPPENRDPARLEKQACMPRVHEIIYLVDPLIIVPMGKPALQAMARGRAWGIETTHGKLFSTPAPEFRVTGEPTGLDIEGRVFPRTGDNKLKHTLSYDLIPVFDPSYLLRSDSLDEKTGEYQPGGPTYNTVHDLVKVTERIEQLKAAHAATQRMLQRR